MYAHGPPDLDFVTCNFLNAVQKKKKNVKLPRRWKGTRSDISNLSRSGNQHSTRATPHATLISRGSFFNPERPLHMHRALFGIKVSD